MKKTILGIILILVCMFHVNAQQIWGNQGSKFDVNKLEFGGNIGFSFGKSGSNGNYTSLNFTPQVGYRFDSKFSAGFGPSYIYRGYSKLDYSENYGGLTFYARYYPIKYLTLQVRPEFYRTWGRNFESRFVPSLLLGAGATIPIGNNSGVSFMLSYDIIQNDYSPYWNQVVYSIGYVIGF